MRQTDSYLASNISATTAAFNLQGGQYAFEYSATWGGGSVTLERLGPDKTTFIACATAWSANGYATAYLPYGTYKLVVATSSAIYAEIIRIPGE